MTLHLKCSELIGLAEEISELHNVESVIELLLFSFMQAHMKGSKCTVWREKWHLENLVLKSRHFLKRGINAKEIGAIEDKLVLH